MSNIEQQAGPVAPEINTASDRRRGGVLVPRTSSCARSLPTTRRFAAAWLSGLTATRSGRTSKGALTVP